MTEQIEAPASHDPVAAYRARLRRNRLMLVLGFLLIAIVGGAWAGLTKDPIGRDNPALQVFPVDGRFVEVEGEEFFVEEPALPDVTFAPTTTVVLGP
ncbi:MAG: hypothetical protein R2770_14190 [Acidimicrobiales bacterium]|nr:hypothetical protein [Acidimicrobiales bacterium]